VKYRPGDETAAFELAMAAQPQAEFYVFKLFVTGASPRSSRAIRNITAICEKELPGRYQLEVIDIYQHPEQAKPEQVVAAPTLVRTLPLPVRKVIGDLSDRFRVMIGLEIVPRKLPDAAKESHEG
jgi:circadian clock protein KaiB